MTVETEWRTEGLGPFEEGMARHAAYRWLDMLGRRFEGPARCRIEIERTDGASSPVRVAVELEVPDRARVGAVRAREDGETNEEVTAALEDAFLRVDAHLASALGQGGPAHDSTGSVARLYPEGYGFIRDDRGREVFFRSDVVQQNQFEHLHAGRRVRFSEAPAATSSGPVALAVWMVDEPLMRPWPNPSESMVSGRAAER